MGIPTPASPKGFAAVGEGMDTAFREGWGLFHQPASAPLQAPSRPVAAAGFARHSRAGNSCLIFLPCPELIVSAHTVCFLLQKACPLRNRIYLNDLVPSPIDQSSDNKPKKLFRFTSLKSSRFSVAAKLHESLCRPFSAQLLIPQRPRTLFL